MTKRERRALLAFAKQARSFGTTGLWLVQPDEYWAGCDLLPYPEDMPRSMREWAEIAESMAREWT